MVIDAIEFSTNQKLVKFLQTFDDSSVTERTFRSRQSEDSCSFQRQYEGLQPGSFTDSLNLANNH